MSAAPLVHIFDGHMYLFRAFFSMTPMSAPDGLRTEAVYGFANTLLRYVEERSATHVAIAFDHAMTSFRNELEPGYKADRGDPPPELEPQFELARQVAEALGFACFEAPNYEADDVIATLTQDLLKRGARVQVVSGDKDLTQLVRADGRVGFYDLARERHFDAEAVEKKFGVWPEQIPDYLGLVGDAVDCLPGVPGVGPKSAAALLQTFGSIDAIPDDPNESHGLKIRGAGKMIQRVANHRARALKTRELARLYYEVPGATPGLRPLQYRGAEREALESLFERLGWGERIRSRVIYHEQT